MQKDQEKENLNFKQKQELELQAFLKKQREERNNFDTGQSSRWNDLKERHNQETWRLYGKQQNQEENRGTLQNLWVNSGEQRERKVSWNNREDIGRKAEWNCLSN